MSEFIKHECGIAFLRLRKNLQYYIDKYETPAYALNKLYLLAEKQHNRGQDGAGIATIKLNSVAGKKKFWNRERSIQSGAIQDIFYKATKKLRKKQKHFFQKCQNAEWLKNHIPFMGEVYMGHLRYNTYGKRVISNCHPIIREGYWPRCLLALAGNFTFANSDNLNDLLVSLGKQPCGKKDTYALVEKIGYFLDEEIKNLEKKFPKFSKEKSLNADVLRKIEENIDLKEILKKTFQDIDGGYAVIGATGYGAAFAVRDPVSIRPIYYYADEEIIVIASERPAIKTAFDEVSFQKIREIEGGKALLIDSRGNYTVQEFMEQMPKRACSFERIYFSRGTDPDIYTERKNLGRLLCPQVLKAIHYDLENTIFSYIPNTAETAFLGLLDELEKYLNKKRINALHKGTLDESLLSFSLRTERIVIKDTKLRTFITRGSKRNNLVKHIYDTTYEIIRPYKDTLVIIDDSIVRGTTLEKSIIRVLDQLNPKRIVIVSSAPQIRYPDCYGIDMSQIEHLIAFRAMINLLISTKREYIREEVYKKALTALKEKNKSVRNYIKELYAPFSDKAISTEIARIITQQKDTKVKADIQIVYQTVENLHKACPNHTGDWYFTGDYPTMGGNIVVNKSFVHFIEGTKTRAY